MIGFALFALTSSLQATAQNEPVVVEQNVINVTAQRLRAFRAKWDIEDDGSASCTIKRRTGQPDLDELACGAVTACVNVNRDLIMKGRDRRSPLKERRVFREQAKTVMYDCAANRFFEIRDNYPLETESPVDLQAEDTQ